MSNMIKHDISYHTYCLAKIAPILSSNINLDIYIACDILFYLLSPCLPHSHHLCTWHFSYAVLYMFKKLLSNLGAYFL